MPLAGVESGKRMVTGIDISLVRVGKGEMDAGLQKDRSALQLLNVPRREV